MLHIIIIILLLVIISFLVYIGFFKKYKFDCVCKQQPPSSVLASSEPLREIDINGLDGKPKQWILMVKLGSGGTNCENDDDGRYSCNFLYADNENQSIKYVTEFYVDSENSKNPAYQLYQLSKNNKFVSWNDGGSKSCSGASGWAHDKGILAFDKGKTQGVYCQHSNPNWGNFNTGFTASGDAGNSGLQTSLAQHMLFVKLSTKDDIDNIVSLMNQANVCILDGSIDGYNPCVRSKTCIDEYLTKEIGGLTMIAKPKGERGDDAWSQVNINECEDEGMQVWSFCVPGCPLGNDGSRDPINQIRDVTNDNSIGSDLKTTCGMDFSEFHSNHSKIGTCDTNNKVIIGGNNHSTPSQGSRGGIFVVIDSSKLSEDFKCLFG